jgi:Lar family restriction alleviation protein
MELEIKPCPFCGNTKLKVESKHHGSHYYEGTHSATVRCSKCHARGPTASCKVEKGKYHTDEATNQRAIELWNNLVIDEVDLAIETHFASQNSYEAGKQVVLDEIDDILDRCAHDNGAMIVRALKELREKYRR